MAQVNLAIDRLIRWFGLPAVISGGQLADGRWWYAAGLFAAAVVYRLYKEITQRRGRRSR